MFSLSGCAKVLAMSAPPPPHHSTSGSDRAAECPTRHTPPAQTELHSAPPDTHHPISGSDRAAGAHHQHQGYSAQHSPYKCCQEKQEVELSTRELGPSAEPAVLSVGNVTACHSPIWSLRSLCSTKVTLSQTSPLSITNGGL